MNADLELMNVRRAAELAAISPRTIERLIAEQKLRATRIGRSVRISRAELTRFFASSTCRGDSENNSSRKQCAGTPARAPRTTSDQAASYHDERMTGARPRFVLAIEFLADLPTSTPAERAALLAALAWVDFDTGELWPSIPNWARAAGMTDRSMRRIVRRLTASGIMEVVESSRGGLRPLGIGDTARYRIPVLRISANAIYVRSEMQQRAKSHFDGR